MPLGMPTLSDWSSPERPQIFRWHGISEFGSRGGVFGNEDGGVRVDQRSSIVDWSVEYNHGLTCVDAIQLAAQRKVHVSSREDVDIFVLAKSKKFHLSVSRVGRRPASTMHGQQRSFRGQGQGFVCISHKLTAVDP